MVKIVEVTLCLALTLALPGAAFGRELSTKQSADGRCRIGKPCGKKCISRDSVCRARPAKQTGSKAAASRTAAPKRAAAKTQLTRTEPAPASAAKTQLARTELAPASVTAPPPARTEPPAAARPRIDYEALAKSNDCKYDEDCLRGSVCREHVCKPE
jgi:hypothetical protein